MLFRKSLHVNNIRQFHAVQGTALQRKSHLWIPFLGIARPQSQFPHSWSVSDLYIPSIGPHISCRELQDHLWEYVIWNIWMWKLDCGRAIPFLEIFVLIFQYWFFTVCFLLACSLRFRKHLQRACVPRGNCYVYDVFPLFRKLLRQAAVQRILPLLSLCLPALQRIHFSQGKFSLLVVGQPKKKGVKRGTNRFASTS